jgi:hypothetical protein
MRQLAAEVSGAHGVSATAYPVDLSAPGSVEALVQELDTRGVTVDILVNNAAFGLTEPFVNHDAARLRAMLQLNMISLSELTLSFGRRMERAGKGHILLVASTAAYQPTPLMAAYGATKGFILSLGEALHVELAPSVTVTVLSPGLMETGFNTVTGFVPPPAAMRFLLPTDRVAKVGLDAMFAGRPSVIPGGWNKVGAFANRLMSHHRAARIYHQITQGH